MDRLDELAIFVAIIEAGSLAGAARRLRRSRPAITRALATLEDRVGQRLITRSTRRFMPSEAGRELAIAARRLLGDYEASLGGVSDAPVSGLLRVTAPLSFGRRHVTPLVSEFLDRYPLVQVELVLGDRNLDLIKGGGGMLLREKIVAASSRKMVVIADETKLVPRLGKFPLPVEVVAFGHKSTALRLAAAVEALGYTRVAMTLRQRDGETFKTDSGNVIYDCAFASIGNAGKLAAALHAVPGVVEHGLFSGMATTLLIATAGEIETIERS